MECLPGVLFRHVHKKHALEMLKAVEAVDADYFIESHKIAAKKALVARPEELPTANNFRSQKTTGSKVLEAAPIEEEEERAKAEEKVEAAFRAAQEAVAKEALETAPMKAVEAALEAGTPKALERAPMKAVEAAHRVTSASASVAPSSVGYGVLFGGITTLIGGAAVCSTYLNNGGNRYLAAAITTATIVIASVIYCYCGRANAAESLER